MADLTTIFKDALEAERASVAARDPFLLTGQSILEAAPKIDISEGDTSDQFLFAALSGLLGGGLGGLGQARVQDKYANQFAIPLQQALASKDPVQAMVGNRKLAGMAPLMQAYQQNIADELFQKRAEQLSAASLRGADAIYEGDQIVQQRINPLTGEFEEVGRGPRWQDSGGGMDAAAKAMRDAQAKLDAMIATGETERKDSGVIAGAAKELRATQAYKDFEHVDTNFAALIKAGDDTSAMSDVQFTYSTIHALEPRLAVKQGEFDAVQGSTSLPDSMKHTLLKAMTGEASLSPRVRRDILNLVKRKHEELRLKVAGNRDLLKEHAGGQLYHPEKDFKLSGFPLVARNAPRIAEGKDGKRYRIDDEAGTITEIK